MVSIDFQAHENAEKLLPLSRLIIGSRQLTEGTEGEFEHISPTTGLVQARIPMGGTYEINEAVEAAQAAFETWGYMRPAKRRKILTRFATLVADHLDDFGNIAPLENGIPVSGFRYGHARVVEEWTSYYAGWADKVSGGVDAAFSDEEHFEYSIPEPYGVVGHIITWNAPAMSLAMKIPACLAAGNTVVIKPSELTPWSAMLWTDLAREAGIPDGVINVVTGSGAAGEALVRHPLVQKISFTGGPPTATKIMQSGSETLTPMVFELGGKSANLFFDDADFLPSIRQSAVGCMGNSGQGCANPTRLLIQDTIYDQVIDGVKDALSKLVPGDPLDPATTQGPMVNQTARERILSMIEEAKSSGSGKLVLGGARIGDVGNFIEPTLFIDTDNRSPIAQQEIFGPVLVAMPFSTEEEAVALANDTQFGLTAWIQSSDVSRIMRLVPRLRAGTVMVNAGPTTVACSNSPFGGQGQSGFGREGGKAGLEEFIRPKGVSIGRNATNFVTRP